MLIGDLSDITRNWPSIIGCRYLPPGPWLPSQPLNITAISQRHYS